MPDKAINADDPDFVPVTIGRKKFKLCYVGKSLRLAREKHGITLASLNVEDPQGLTPDDAVEHNYRIILVGLLYYHPDMTVDYIEDHIKLSQLSKVVGIAMNEFGAAQDDEGDEDEEPAETEGQTPGESKAKSQAA